MSSRMKKTRTTTTLLPLTSQQTQISSLPDDLLISVFARVSRLDYPILSLVSKRFRSLLASPELYATRSFLGRTESCLYLCLRFPFESKPRWFTLCRKPNPTLTISMKKKLTGHVMAAISIPNSPPAAQLSSLVAVGSDIYNIGSIYEEYSSSVSILDCRSHTWRKAPSMLVERTRPAANLFDGKIYVVGGCKESNSSNWMEAFDLKTQTWEHVFNPIADKCETTNICMSAVIGKSIYLFGCNNKGVTYNPKIGRWEAIGAMKLLDLGWRRFTNCVIDNVLYSFCCFLGLQSYDPKIGRWIKLKGLDGLLRFNFHQFVGLADYGGKMALFWYKYLPSSGYKNKVVWCAVITLQKRHNEEIYGKIEWLDAVLTVPKDYDFLCARAAIV